MNEEITINGIETIVFPFIHNFIFLFFYLYMPNKI